MFHNKISVVVKFKVANNNAGRLRENFKFLAFFFIRIDSSTDPVVKLHPLRQRIYSFQVNVRRRKYLEEFHSTTLILKGITANCVGKLGSLA